MSEKKTKLQKMTAKMDNMATMIELELANLENWGQECHCNRDLGFVNIIHQGEFYMEYLSYCLECGGYIHKTN